jgi:class 3 adenylate cyclase
MHNHSGHTAFGDPEAMALFDQLLGKFSATSDIVERSRIDDEVWERFGTEGAVFISDMSGFSRSTRALGICHFLAQIHRIRPIVGRAVSDHGGTLIKCETDNCYAYFPAVDEALEASLKINAELAEINMQLDSNDRAFVSIGIDFGKLLLIGSDEYYGDPVNTASKLGEDLAARSEILLTQRAMDRVTLNVEKDADPRRERISGIDIDYVCFDMAVRLP